jgi:uroporphyrin-III C-methyltransferase/precorrin-2 dehydrogenase/sirohydrochlorin ferrochelatase
LAPTDDAGFARGAATKVTPPLTWPGLPVLVKLDGRPVILVGEGEAADAKRRLLERAGAVVVTDHPHARLAVVALDDEALALAAVERLRARGLLVNAVDRPALCDFTLPAVVDRSPVLVAVMTGGVSAGLAAAVRQRLDALLPSTLGRLADALFAARAALRRALPDMGERRRAIGSALTGELDPFDPEAVRRVAAWVERAGTGQSEPRLERIALRSADPDDLTLRQARWLALADRVYHHPATPVGILDRARADAARIVSDAPPDDGELGLSVWVGWA